MNSSEEKEREKLIGKRRKAKLSIEELLDIYCKQNGIKDNEITEKINSIYYDNPENHLKIDYNKNKGQKFPLPNYLASKKLNYRRNIEYREQDREIKDHIIEKESKEENKDEEHNEEKADNDLDKCIICQWKFLPEMSLEEKSNHIDLCLQGKGEENKKGIISTYNEIEVFKILSSKEKKEERKYNSCSFCHKEIKGDISEHEKNCVKN